MCIAFLGPAYNFGFVENQPPTADQQPQESQLLQPARKARDRQKPTQKERLKKNGVLRRK